MTRHKSFHAIIEHETVHEFCNAGGGVYESLVIEHVLGRAEAIFLPGVRAGDEMHNWRPPHAGDTPSKRWFINNDHALLLPDPVSRLTYGKCTALSSERSAQSCAIQPDPAVDINMQAKH